MRFLTAQQKTFFDTFGYLAFPGLLHDQAGDIIRAFESVWTESGGGHGGRPHDGKQRSCIVPFADQSESLCRLLDDPRIEGIAADLLGDDFNYMGSDGNYYTGDTQWHSDGWHTDILHIKLAFYLDPLTRDTGALRVIPGSHHVHDHFGQVLGQQIGNSKDSWAISGAQVPAVALETRPGDVVLFNHNIKHASFGGAGWRRMFTLNLCQRYPEAKLDSLRQYIGGSARFWVDRAFGKTMMETAGPGRMRHLEQVMANDGHLAELSRQARATMPEPARG